MSCKAVAVAAVARLSDTEGVLEAGVGCVGMSLYMETLHGRL